MKSPIFFLRRRGECDIFIIPMAQWLQYIDKRRDIKEEVIFKNTRGMLYENI